MREDNTHVGSQFGLVVLGILLLAWTDGLRRRSPGLCSLLLFRGTLLLSPLQLGLGDLLAGDFVQVKVLQLIGRDGSRSSWRSRLVGHYDSRLD